MTSSKFHTTVEIPMFKKQTGYSKKNMFLGSCFTENIGNRMAELKYNIDINPFGILYNPVSVANGLRILLDKKVFTSEDLVESDGLWHSFFHHGRFSSPNKNETIEIINNRIKSSNDFLKSADFLFITFGTAWIYKYKNTGQTVSNCHKIHAGDFNRERLTVNEIVQNYTELFIEIRKINPSIQVVFTVSPIRHWKDGAIENQRSKAILLLAIETIIKDFGHDFCSYFPAYEIVMDELRDYRFYAPDMLHISEVAIDYIWEKFEKSLIDPESQHTAKKVDKIVKAVNHKPLHGNTDEYYQFLGKMHEKALQLEHNNEHLDLTSEKKCFMTGLEKIASITTVLKG
ncbi:MAG: GSCFA domain-containing protein [Draconibacterium sp.]|nr:GSCFA domain-containing protein [Draconibacterium sp.]